MKTWLERKTDKYTSPEVQNELMKIMALTILRDITGSVMADKFYALMADEVADVSNKEQVAICLRSIDDNFEAHENFIGMHVVDFIRSEVLVATLKDVLMRLNLSIHNCDGAANMACEKNGVAVQLANEECCAIFTHCYGHALNLAAGDTRRARSFEMP